ncbi:N-acetylglutaminylglutamine amidotransferase [Naasia sp. SYSU D00057]|uniref:N-acetylglutaminylglutamine amidotransferase n=1 Tax=Naasia sp. SYSU D00057 TaxID=2817380 RepID=UPI001B30D6AA|nr:N-acetylglutaminylglutamine amidotransferase [Naasia sp. SYSU D00057]
MCGIAGDIVFSGGRADLGAVSRMTAELERRGPDGGGGWDGGWVALGHRRLKVIDLSSDGAQPFVDDELGLSLVFNGCIYNHHELRRELEGEYRFTSTSDTEVVLKAYSRWGEDFVHHLVGMFAVAIVDVRRKRVVLARDRLGIKPIYLTERPGALRFASTLPALLAAGGVDTELDEAALHHYLTMHSIVPAPRTILRGVSKLPAATVRVIEADGRQRDTVYWEPSYTRDPERADWSGEDWREAIRDALRTAVRRRLVADVPVGVLLSGGLDSSLLVALLAEEGAETPRTFSIGFEGAGGVAGDEFEFSDIVAAAYGTRHERLRIDGAELLPALPEAIRAMTEPMSSHDVTAFYLLSQAVSEHLRVVQSGQGADEVFAGYGYHQPAASAPRDAAADAFTGSFLDRSHAELARILQPERLPGFDASGELMREELGRDGADEALDAVLRADTHLLMIDDPVKRVDSMTMAWGLEARVPFLDQDLVALAAACPPELKAAQGGKGILKDIGREVLPEGLVDRPKGYFPVPALVHLEGPFLDFARDALTAPEARERGVFRREYIDALLEHPDDRLPRSGASSLWQAAVLELWLQEQGVR